MSSKTKIEIKSIFGKVLFSYKCEDNSIKKTVLKAVEQNADLRNANLRNANLRNANLWNADLSGANLRNANLSDADLLNADLRNANLRNANLSDANLRNANLRNANLKEIKKDFIRVLDIEHTYLHLFKLELLKGFVDGSNYDEKCSCLCGTLKKRANVKIRDKVCNIQNPESPIERFLLGIRRGMTPLYNDLVRVVYEWTCEYIEEHKVKSCLTKEEQVILDYLEKEYEEVNN